MLDIDVSWVNGNYQRILFHSVRTASADRVREMAAPRRHLALVCFLHQAWRDTLDQAVDMYGKLLDRNRKLVDDRLDDMLKAQRHAVDRIVRISITTSLPAYATTGRDSTIACAPCGRTTCSSSGSSIASAATSPIWSTPCRTCPPAA